MIIAIALVATVAGILAAVLVPFWAGFWVALALLTGAVVLAALDNRDRRGWPL